MLIESDRILVLSDKQLAVTIIFCLNDQRNVFFACFESAMSEGSNCFFGIDQYSVELLKEWHVD